MSDNSLFIEQFVEERLGNSAYLAGSRASKRAVLIDPLRDVDQYRRAAERNGVQITHILDTHLHNDFVSGARELAAQTGATIGVGAQFGVEFEHQPLEENQLLVIGDLSLRVMATPGHTPEHIAFVLETEGKPQALFSGGALMVGGAARTDLLGHEHAVPLARQSYHTIHDKLLALDDAVALYPTHGAGTFCAAPVSNERTSTIGRERRGNYLALAESEDDFVQRALSGLPSYPVYYPHVRAMNRRGPPILGGVPVLKPLSPEEVQALAEAGVVVLDVRPARRFAQGHLPGAYGIAVDAPLSTWAGWLIPFGTPLVLVADSVTDHVEAVRQLIRIGYDDLRGALHAGMEAWAEAGLPIETVPAMTARELRERLGDGQPLIVLDVRMQSEWEAGHIPGALHIENGRLATDTPALPAHQPIAVHCAHGARSMAGISVLMRKGYHNLIHVNDGITGWQKAGGDVVRDG
jgi:hydroxyacylglutathione hydrolase